MAIELPNTLPPSSYEYFEKTRSFRIGQAELQAHHQGLPQYDDGQFIAELADLQDEAVVIFWDNIFINRRTGFLRNSNSD